MPEVDDINPADTFYISGETIIKILDFVDDVITINGTNVFGKGPNFRSRMDILERAESLKYDVLCEL